MSKRRHLDSELDINPKRSKTAGTNARFDRMIDSLSVVHHGGPAGNASNAAKKRRGRSLSQLNDAYNPPPADHLRRGLSFSKMGHESSSPSSYFDEDGPSSDSVEVSHASTSRRGPCNPLPKWLANTFLSLSKKHPLRLSLPADLAQASSGDACVSSKAGDTDDLFSFNVSSIEESNDCQSTQFQQIGSYNDTAICCTPALCNSSPSDFPVLIPFSTPGPGSLLGSSSISKPIFSLPLSQAGSSPTLYNVEALLPSNRAPTPLVHSCSISSPPYTFRTDELDSDHIPLEFANSLHFSEMYTSPGPTYNAPLVHFDSPTEDPLLSEPDTAFHDQVDFCWKPFDRKCLVAPTLPKPPAFAYDRSTPQAGTDRLMAVSPVSPSPFPFTPTDKSGHSAADNFPVGSVMVPESQDLPQDRETPPLQMLTSAPAPEICMPTPFGLSPGRTSASPRVAEIDN